MKRWHRWWAAWLVVIWLLVILSVTGWYDERQAATEVTKYCELVAVWQASPLPPEARPGWPPYQGPEMCDETK